MPDPTKGQGPLYARIADQIEQAIGTGVLAAGTKLPPQRNLAFDIGVTIGTIGRAYHLVRERGLVSGERLGAAPMCSRVPICGRPSSPIR